MEQPARGRLRLGGAFLAGPSVERRVEAGIRTCLQSTRSACCNARRGATRYRGCDPERRCSKSACNPVELQASDQNDPFGTSMASAGQNRRGPEGSVRVSCCAHVGRRAADFEGLTRILRPVTKTIAPGIQAQCLRELAVEGDAPRARREANAEEDSK